MKTDDLDERILEVLGTDARISNRELGRTLDVADVTIGKRLMRLQKAGAVRTVALVDPRALGLNCAAFVRIVASPSLARPIAENAAKMREVPFVSLASGRHNIVLLVTVEDREALARLLHEQFRQWEGVLTLEVHEIVNSVKHRLDIVRIPPPQD